MGSTVMDSIQNSGITGQMNFFGLFPSVTCDGAIWCPAKKKAAESFKVGTPAPDQQQTMHKTSRNANAKKEISKHS